jgi:hypothetical protein
LLLDHPSEPVRSQRVLSLQAQPDRFQFLGRDAEVNDVRYAAWRSAGVAPSAA